MEQKILLIYNPNSGKNSNRSSTISNLVMELSKQYLVCVHRMKEREDFGELLGQVDQYEFLVCCGGDGTLHYLTNAMLQRGIRCPLAYVPLGSTNDNAKSLGIKKSNVLEVVMSDRTRLIDVGKFGDQYFNYVAAFGIFTSVSYSTPQNLKNEIGYLAYLLEGIGQVGKINGREMTIRTDTREFQGRFLVGVISNSLSVAGMKQKGVDVSNLADGMLDYVFIKEPRSIADIQGILQELLSGGYDNKYLLTGRSRSFHFTSEKLDWTLDGEFGGTYEEIDISVVSGQMEIKTGH